MARLSAAAPVSDILPPPEIPPLGAARRSHVASTVKLWIVAAAYGLWLFGVHQVFYLVNGTDQNALQLAVMLGFIPAALQLMVLGVDTVGLLAPAKLVLALILVILLSYLGHTYDWMPLAYVFDTLFLMAVALMVAGSPDRRLLRSLAVMFAIPTACQLLYVDFYGEYVWGRLTAHTIQPNYWGMIGAAVVIASLGARWLPLILAGGAVGFLTIYDASSRGSLVAFAAALMAAIFIEIRSLRGYRLFGALVAAGLILSGLVILEPRLYEATNFVSSDLLLLHDPNRGEGTGLTGRTEAWHDAIDIWLTSPLLGVGYHQHAQMLPDFAGSHNAYLAMLADTGPLGLIIYVVLLIWAGAASLGVEDHRTRRLIAALIAAYIFYGFIEGRAFNNGNPFSFLFNMCCFYAIAEQQRRKAALRLSRLRSQAVAAGSDWQGLPAP